jgi:hypothetical protein
VKDGHSFETRERLKREWKKKKVERGFLTWKGGIPRNMPHISRTYREMRYKKGEQENGRNDDGGKG